ncbi:hypothetical protein ACQP3J_33370, partial [Escherichia coli]
MSKPNVELTLSLSHIQFHSGPVKQLRENAGFPQSLSSWFESKTSFFGTTYDVNPGKVSLSVVSLA